MKILVTGGCGFIGQHLVKALIESGHAVVVLDNMRRGNRNAIPETAELVEADIRDRDAVRHVMAGCERVYHLAAQSNVIGATTDMDYSFTSNVVGTYHVLSAAVEFGIKRVVFTSSREVYGEVRHAPVSEDCPIAPKNAYGASKAAGEAYCRAFQATYGLDVSILRLANVYGPGDRDRVIPIWLDRAAHGDSMEIFGGHQILDFVPIGLTIQALLQAGDRSLDGRPVNIGSGHGVALRDLARQIRHLPGASGDIHVLPARSMEVTRFVANVRHMRERLGLEPPNEPLADLPALWDAIHAHVQPRDR